MATTSYIREWRENRRQAARLQLGGKCVRCGSVEGLEFDHIDPATKVDTIANLATASEEIFQAELAKNASSSALTVMTKNPPEKLPSPFGMEHSRRTRIETVDAKSARKP